MVSNEEAKETGRIEAFSDGVFAVAITLLIFEIKMPSGPNLAQAVLLQWPAFVAYVVSFMIVLVMWVNHHAIFNLLQRTDRCLQMINGVVLMVVTFLNYPAALVAASLGTPNQRFAVLLYNGTCFLVSVTSNLLWRYAVHNDRLLIAGLDRRVVQIMNAQYRLGPLLFFAVLGLTYLHATAALVGNLCLTLYFAFTARCGTAPYAEMKGMPERREACKTHC